MTDFYNAGMAAPNVLTFAIDPAIAEEFAGFDPVTTEYDLTRPNWNSDIGWYAPATEAAFETFQSAFDRLGIARHAEPYLELDRAVRMYAGFLIVRSDCAEADFHVDWKKTRNQAFTVIIPVSGDYARFGLLYRQLAIAPGGDGLPAMAIAEYPYRRGEAIMIGEHFHHSTKPGCSAEPVTLLSFTFGTDRMEYWDGIRRNTTYQSRLKRRPDGCLVRDD